MNEQQVQQLTRAVLYEGYALYPYRSSAIKNQKRFTFGTLFPARWCECNRSSEPHFMRAQVLVTGGTPIVSVMPRFLQLVTRRVARPIGPAEIGTDLKPVQYQHVQQLSVGNAVYSDWEEAMEREVAPIELAVSELAGHSIQNSFTFPADVRAQAVQEQGETIVFERSYSELDGIIAIEVRQLDVAVFRMSVEVQNHSILADRASPDAAKLSALASAHVLLAVRDGQFASLLEPPAPLASRVGECRQVGCFPVLLGQPPQASMMFCSPIILYDDPQIAPQSGGDFFDGTEIDEMLSLRVQTMTDDEKREMRGLDERVRQILQRTETLSNQQLADLHGKSEVSI